MENHILKGLHLDGDRDVTDNNCDGDKPFSPYVHIGPLTVTEQREVIRYYDKELCRRVKLQPRTAQ